jgi:hypothetical protein
MSKTQRILKQKDSIQESRDKAVRVVQNFSKIDGVEGGLHLNMFDHDSPEDMDCICDLPEQAQRHIWKDLDA